MKEMVSVIIPTYKRPNNLTRAIDSVLAQEYTPIEIIVVDDNGLGTECQIQTEMTLQKYIVAEKIKYIKHPKNLNGSAARNTGLKACIGDYYTFLDDDDFLYPQKIGKQIDYLHKHPEFDMVYCGYEKKGNEKTKNFQAIKEGNLQLELLMQTWGFGSGSNPLFRRCVLEEVGYFDESFMRHQDLEYMARCLRKSKIGAINEILMTKFLDSNSNRPSVEKYITVKMHFLETFKEDIDTYRKTESCSIFRNHLYVISILALGERKYGIAFKYLRKAMSYRVLTLRQFLKFTYILLTKGELSR